MVCVLFLHDMCTTSNCYKHESPALLLAVVMLMLKGKLIRQLPRVAPTTSAQNTIVSPSSTRYTVELNPTKTSIHGGKNSDWEQQLSIHIICYYNTMCIQTCNQYIYVLAVRGRKTNYAQTTGAWDITKTGERWTV